MTSRIKTKRSTDADDYQFVPRLLAAMSKSFSHGHEIEPHQHARDQLVYSVSGVMRIRTTGEAWIVPPDRALYLPAHTTHAIGIRGQVEMRTLYIARRSGDELPNAPTVLDVSPLLRELIVGLIDEPVIYDEAGRGGAMALVIPMPRDPRLLRLCNALLADPANRMTLEAWADETGASPRTLARLFESKLGLSFAAWRQRVRFHNALEAIVAGDPIARVAERNGYRSSSAFAAAFRKVMGYAPRSLRDAA
jgi:AraC-like DNA-binding protein/mannose-6-phosphate isomerase-like protein (cupin superfamily)